MKGINNIEKKTFKELRYIPFGKFIINHYQLTNNNILLLKYPTLAPVTNLKRTIISDELKMLLEDLVTNQKINTDLQKQLKNDEMLLFEKILKLANLEILLNYKRHDMNIEDYYKRYQLLIGGMEAGNQSEEIKLELKTILNKFIKNNVIDNIEGLELIKILS